MLCYIFILEQIHKHLFCVSQNEKMGTGKTFHLDSSDLYKRLYIFFYIVANVTLMTYNV